MLEGNSKSKGYGARSLKGSLSKKNSQSNTNIRTHRKTASKMENRCEAFEKTTRYQESARNSYAFR